jgi:hypothetical protein
VRCYVALLSNRINDLMAQMKAGDLSRPDQILLSSLTELKSETEQGLRGYWEDAAANL